MEEKDCPQTWYVYVYIDDEAIPFYVGKGTRGRMFAHEDEARTGCGCMKCQRIRQLWTRGIPVIKHIVFETFDENEALRRESELIDEYSGTLLNIRGTDAPVRKGRAKKISPHLIKFPIEDSKIVPTCFNGRDIGTNPLMIRYMLPNGSEIEFALNGMVDPWGPLG